MRAILTIVLVTLLPIFAYAVGITFTFDNTQITGTSPKFFEFDVMVTADASGTKIGDTQVYINYNTQGFGESISTTGMITVTRGTFINNSNYRNPVVNDNALNRVSIVTEFQGAGAEDGSDLPTTPTQLLHISIQIQNESETSGLSFEQALMNNAQFQSDYGTYDQVIAGDTEDSSLPVELSNFSSKILEGTVILNWITESEIHNLGFEVYRAPEKEADYVLLSDYNINADLEGQGNASTRHEYIFTDNSAEPEKTYWYKLADLDYSGVKTFHGPISVTTPKALPTDFKLRSNYPNPFNPSTTIRFDIPLSKSELVDTRLTIYNTLGQVTKRLYQNKLSAGSYEVLWDGTTDAGNNAPSGVYFVVFRANNFTQTRKIILIK